jgi:hypothetical protein
MVGLPNESPTFCFDRDELSMVEFEGAKKKRSFECFILGRF